eukprot:jgi/Mesvir1/11817/Mv00173-RA.2
MTVRKQSEQSAIAIQSVFRGYMVREALKDKQWKGKFVRVVQQLAYVEHCRRINMKPNSRLLELYAPKTVEAQVVDAEEVDFARHYRNAITDHDSPIVDLSYNYIGEKGFQPFFENMLQANNDMVQLKLNHTGVGNACVAKLCAWLAHHANVREVDLRGNDGITDKGTRMLLELVKTNPNIHVCHVDSKYISPFIKTQLTKQLEANRRMQGKFLPAKPKEPVVPPKLTRTHTARSDSLISKKGGDRPAARANCFPGLIAAKQSSAVWLRKRAVMEKARAEQARAAAATARAKGLVTHVLTEKDLDKVAYERQVNLDMYSEENLRRRDKLRRHPLIRRCLDRWWHAIIIPKFDSDHDGYLSKWEYFLYHKALNEALNPNEEPISEEEAEKMAQEDWEHDCKGAHRISMEVFQDAMFELADLWVETVNAQDYIDFLDFLHFKVLQNCVERTEKDTHVKEKGKRTRAIMAPTKGKGRKRKNTARLESLGIQHHFTPEDLATLHQHFKMKATDGVLDHVSFNTIMRGFGFKSLYLLSRLFVIFDADQSNTIDWKELLVSLGTLVCSSRTDCLKMAFKIYDVDNSNAITLHELLTMLRAAGNTNGNAAVKELCKICKEEFTNVDLDKSGTLTFKEFVTLIEKHPGLVDAMLGVPLEGHFRVDNLKHVNKRDQFGYAQEVPDAVRNDYTLTGIAKPGRMDEVLPKEGHATSVQEVPFSKTSMGMAEVLGRERAEIYQSQFGPNKNT